MVLNVGLNRLRATSIGSDLAIFLNKFTNTGIDSIFKTMERVLGVQVDILRDKLKKVVGSMGNILCRFTSNP